MKEVNNSVQICSREVGDRAHVAPAGLHRPIPHEPSRGEVGVRTCTNYFNSLHAFATPQRLIKVHRQKPKNLSKTSFLLDLRPFWWPANNLHPSSITARPQTTCQTTMEMQVYMSMWSALPLPLTSSPPTQRGSTPGRAWLLPQFQTRLHRATVPRQLAFLLEKGCFARDNKCDMFVWTAHFVYALAHLDA